MLVLINLNWELRTKKNQTPPIKNHKLSSIADFVAHTPEA